MLPKNILLAGCQRGLVGLVNVLVALKDGFNLYDLQGRGVASNMDPSLDTLHSRKTNLIRHLGIR